MSAREPMFDSGPGDRQLARGDFENSNTGSGHARDSNPPVNDARRSLLRPRPPGSASATTTANPFV